MERCPRLEHAHLATHTGDQLVDVRTLVETAQMLERHDGWVFPKRTTAGKVLAVLAVERQFHRVPINYSNALVQ